MHDGSSRPELDATVCSILIFMLCQDSVRRAAIVISLGAKSVIHTTSNFHTELIGGYSMALILSAIITCSSCTHNDIKINVDNVGVVANGNDCFLSLPENQLQADVLFIFLH